MRTHFLALILLFFTANTVAQNTSLKIPTNQVGPFSQIIKDKLKAFTLPSQGELDDLLSGEVLSNGNVSSPRDKEQKLTLMVVGIHPRTCSKAMRKLSLYENYHNYMDFIKTSSYEDATQKFSFTIDHTLLPFSMIVRFKIPRITGPGQYPFIFEDGFLKNLKGTVVVENLGPHCLMALRSDWQGPETKIPNIIFGSFIQTVGKLGLEHLIRVSLF